MHADSDDDFPFLSSADDDPWMREWCQARYRRKRRFDREKNRKLRTLADPEFWHSIAEMQRRLGSPAGGIGMRDYRTWIETLFDNIFQPVGTEGFQVVIKPVKKRALMRQARADGIKVLAVSDINPDKYEARRLCRAWPILSASIDELFVAEIARKGLLRVLRQLESILKGNLYMSPFFVDARHRFRGKLSKGQPPLDPDAAVRIFRWNQRGESLVEIGRKLGWKVYPNFKGGEHCPRAAHYRDKGREIVEAYDADSRPCLRVPSFAECVRHGWISLAA